MLLPAQGHLPGNVYEVLSIHITYQYAGTKKFLRVIRDMETCKFHCVMLLCHGYLL